MRTTRTGNGVLTRDEQVRCAHAALALRPDWNLDQLRIVLTDDRIAARPFPHVAVALAFIASDEETKAPGRLFAPGPWWDAARAKPADTPTPTPRRLSHVDCRECFRPEADHGIDPTLADHEYMPWLTTEAAPMPANLRAAIDAARNTPPPPKRNDDEDAPESADDEESNHA